VSDKKQKRVERRAQREALRKWRQHEPLAGEEYRLLDRMNRGRRSVKALRGGATGLRQQDRRRVQGGLPRTPSKRSSQNSPSKRFGK
jgi:hypothetical protein